MSLPEETTVVTDIRNGVPAKRTDDCLVVIYAHDQSARRRRFRLRRGPVRIGRLADNQLVLDDDSVSRRHARIEARDGRWYLMDVGSVNGTLLNDEVLLGHAELQNGDRIKVGKNIIKYLSGDDVETAYLEEIYLASITDALTRISNRRHFDETFEREFVRARRYRRPLAVMLIDADHFKAVNDRFGHLTGDQVLCELAQRVKRAVPEDTVARFGGEELVVVLAETGIGQACVTAEQIRAAIAAAPIVFRQNEVPVTVSIGCASIEDVDASAADLLGRADEMLYRAKSGGRNRVCG